MSKKAISLALAVMLTVSMIMVTGLNVFAESEESYSADSQDSAEVSDSADSDESEPAETTQPADANGFYPNLTVNAISNYFPRSNSEYNSTTHEVTVTYWLKLSENILNTQWYVTYDPTVLTFSSEKNSVASICPTAGENGVISFDSENTINYCATNMRLFDFSTQSVPFVKLIFDVNSLDADSAVTTTVDLTLDMLSVSKINEVTMISDSNEEIILVEGCEILRNSRTATVEVDYSTSLTTSNYVPPTTAEPTQAATPDEAETLSTEPSESASNIIDASSSALSSPAIDATSSTLPRGKTSDLPDGALDTGDSFLAGIFLIVLIFVTSVLFVMRKKEMLE